MSWCIRYGYVVEIKHVNFCFCAWLHEQGRRGSAKQQKPNVPLYRAHFGEIFSEDAFAFLCPPPSLFKMANEVQILWENHKVGNNKAFMRCFQFFCDLLGYPYFLVQFLMVERRKWFHKYFCPIVHSACAVYSRVRWQRREKITRWDTSLWYRLT